MYRVELKVVPQGLIRPYVTVPNVPCGVESHFRTSLHVFYGLFLMYRVELKEVRVPKGHRRTTRFLMYRVELKGNSLPSSPAFSFFCS